MELPIRPARMVVTMYWWGYYYPYYAYYAPPVPVLDPGYLMWMMYYWMMYHYSYVVTMEIYRQLMEVWRRYAEALAKSLGTQSAQG